MEFAFGYDARSNLEDLAEALPAQAWKPLRRPARSALRTPRARPEKVKDRIVRERKFDVLRLQ